MHASYPLRLEENIGSHGTEVTDGCEHCVDLGIEPASSGRITNTLNHWAISLTPYMSVSI